VHFIRWKYQFAGKRQSEREREGERKAREAPVPKKELRDDGTFGRE